jgi:PAS domain S-box-containing protein
VPPDLVLVHTGDITEHKRAEEALRESEERFRHVAANTGDWIWEVDANGKYTYTNPIVEQVLGYRPEEVLGKHFYDFFLLEEREQLKKTLFEVIARRERFTGFVSRNIHKSGRVVILETSGVPIFSTDGQLLGYRGVDRNITERKILEERLSALNFYGGKLNTANKLQQVYELTLDAMEQMLGFEDATFMVVEKGNLKITCQRGYTKPILLELPLNGTKRGITVRAVNTSKPILVSDVKKDKDYVEGVPGIQSELAVPVVIEDKVLGVLDVESRKVGAFDEKDVTVIQILASHAATAISNLTKRGEIEKRSSQLASLMKSSAEMIHSTDLRQRLQTTAEAIQELGWRRIVISARDENLDIANVEDIVTAGLTKEEKEFLWTNRQPRQVWRERFGQEYERFKIGEFYHLPWSDPWVREKFSKGTVPSYLKPEEMVDWDPQDLLYAPLRLADGRIVGVVSIDDPLDGKRPTKESLAPLELFIHQAAVAIENAKLIRWLNEAKKQIEEYADQLELKVKQRTKELMEAQNRLLKSERLAAIGEIAAMVGHDLRNPLTGIAGATYYLKMKSGPKMNKKTKEMLELIEGDIEYSNKIINDLLEYSREIQLELTETTPKIIIKEALSLVKVPKNIQVSDSTRTEPRIRVDVEKMKRVFINIIKNAIDAMPKGGKLTIKSKKTDGNLEIAFADTGIGMSKDVVEKLWTPLFTTKAKGMGLGLPICKRAVEAHGGNISAESTVGKGTTFTVTIPIQPQLEGGEKIWVNMQESLLSKTTKA